MLNPKYKLSEMTREEMQTMHQAALALFETLPKMQRDAAAKLMAQYMADTGAPRAHPSALILSFIQQRLYSAGFPEVKKDVGETFRAAMGTLAAHLEMMGDDPKVKMHVSGMPEDMDITTTDLDALDSALDAL